MTKAEFILRTNQFTKDTKYLVQAIELEDGTKEIQVSAFSLKKVEYISNTYDNEMRHENNNKVRIIDIMVV